MFYAAVERVADLLAEEGDEDPVNVRRAKAVGILGNPAAALDLLNRHARQPEPAQEPWNYEPDPTGTDPWDLAPPAGWATAQNSHYHQVESSDPAYQAGQEPPEQPDAREHEPPEQVPPEEREPDRYGPDGRGADGSEPKEYEPGHRNPNPTDPGPGTPGNGVDLAFQRMAVWPQAEDDGGPGSHDAGVSADEGDESGQVERLRRPLLSDGDLALRPVTRADRRASRPKVQIVFHLTDEAVRVRHGVVRTEAGPITVEELRQFLTDSDADITIRPVLDPARVARSTATRSRFSSGRR